MTAISVSGEVMYWRVGQALAGTRIEGLTLTPHDVVDLMNPEGMRWFQEVVLTRFIPAPPPAMEQAFSVAGQEDTNEMKTHESC